jgi:chromosome segregation ATPase
MDEARELYQYKEDNSIKDNEGKDSPKYFDDNSPCEVEIYLTNEEENIVEVCVYEEEELLKFKEKVLFELGDISMEIGHYSVSYKYLEKIINEVLEKYPNHVMELKQMLKEQEESKQTQLEEKEEEIKRLKDEIINQEGEKKKVYDELRKSLKVNVNLKTKIEEAKRIEELLKNQVNEKEESCHKLEVEVVDIRKKVEK